MSNKLVTSLLILSTGILSQQVSVQKCFIEDRDINGPAGSAVCVDVIIQE